MNLIKYRWHTSQLRILVWFCTCHLCSWTGILLFMIILRLLMELWDLRDHWHAPFLKTTPKSTGAGQKDNKKHYLPNKRMNTNRLSVARSEERMGSNWEKKQKENKNVRKSWQRLLEKNCITNSKVVEVRNIFKAGVGMSEFADNV